MTQPMGSPATSRPLIVCIGNCQSGTVRALLQSTPEIRRDYEVAFVRSRAAFEAVRSRVKVCIQQATHAWDGFHLAAENLPTGATLIRYPVALANYPWPTIPFQRRSKDIHADDGKFQQYPYTLCDDIALRLVDEGVPRDRFVEAYFEVDIAARYPLDRLREINAAKARQIDDKADFGIWDYIEAQGAETQLFRTANHPNGPLMGLIMEAILERIPGLQDRAYAARLVEAWKAGHGVQPVEAPVHPEVAAHFGLKWAPPGRRYTFWNEGDFTFEERLLRLYDFSYCRAYHAGSQAMAEGRVDEAVALLRKAAAELPKSRPVLRLYAAALTRAQDYSSAVVVRRRLFSLDRSALAADEYVGALNRARRGDEAREFLDQLPRTLAGHPLLLLARSRMARAIKQADEADGLLAEAAAGDPDNLQILLEQSRRAEAEGRLDAAIALMDRAHYVSNWSASIGRLLGGLRQRAAGAPAE